MSWAILANLAVPLMTGVALGLSIAALTLARRARRALLGRSDSVTTVVYGAGGKATVGGSGTAVGGAGGRPELVRRSDGSVVVAGGGGGGVDASGVDTGFGGAAPFGGSGGGGYERCPVYPDGQHRNTRSLIPASYSRCECGATSEYNPDRFA